MNTQTLIDLSIARRNANISDPKKRQQAQFNHIFMMEHRNQQEEQVKKARSLWK